MAAAATSPRTSIAPGSNPSAATTCTASGGTCCSTSAPCRSNSPSDPGDTATCCPARLGIPAKSSRPKIASLDVPAVSSSTVRIGSPADTSLTASSDETTAASTVPDSNELLRSVKEGASVMRVLRPCSPSRPCMPATRTMASVSDGRPAMLKMLGSAGRLASTVDGGTEIVSGSTVVPAVVVAPPELPHAAATEATTMAPSITTQRTCRISIPTYA